MAGNDIGLGLAFDIQRATAPHHERPGLSEFFCNSVNRPRVWTLSWHTNGRVASHDFDVKHGEWPLLPPGVVMRLLRMVRRRLARQLGIPLTPPPSGSPKTFAEWVKEPAPHA